MSALLEQLTAIVARMIAATDGRVSHWSQGAVDRLKESVR